MRLSVCVVSILFAVSSLRAQARPSPVTASELPREVARAVSVSTQSVENQIRSKLDGQSEGSLVVDVQVETRGAFHVYSERLEFWTEADPALGGGEWKVEILERPASVRFLDPASKSLKEGYHGQSVFRLRLSLPHSIAKPLPLDHEVLLVTSFQACSDKLCLLPVSVKSPVLSSAATGAKKGSDGFLDAAIRDFRARLTEGEGISPLALGIILLAGLITAFTPCVYPLYPVTLGIFARWSQTSGANPFVLALGYCGGLTLSYASIGLLSGISGAVFGSLTQTAPFLIGVGLLILASALFFSGLFTFPMPAALMNYFSRPDTSGETKQSTARLAFKATLMGAGLGVVASPCVGPVLVAILAWLGTAHASLWKGFLLLAFFGAGMSLPFLVLGHLILRMGRRPSLGRYTPYVKHAGTVLMVVASLSFLVPGIRLATASSTETKLSYAVSTPENWSKAKWTVIDFRADWCAACLEIERETFAAHEVSAHFESGEWEMVRVDMTTPSEALEKIAREYGVVSLPSVLFVKPGGGVCTPSSVFGFVGPKDFLARMTDAQHTCK